MSVYGRWINDWEWQLAHRDPHRRLMSFDWGLEWLPGMDPGFDEPLPLLKQWSIRILQESHEYFGPGPLPEVTLEGDRLSFPTPTPTPYEENNQAWARVWPGRGRDHAVVVVPQWNAGSTSHVALCGWLARLGMTAVRYTLPYHGRRAPGGMRRADLMVSPNIGRTLHATRQAVLEVRALAQWLHREGYRSIGLVGTSLGSCIAYLAFCHESLFRAAVFNHVSAYFGDVVWRGVATRFVRWGLEKQISLPDLRLCWAPISPWYHIDKLDGDGRPHRMITTRYDHTFLPELTRLVLERYAECGIECDVVELPCGHYTLARFPFSYLAGWHICRFLKRELA